MRTVKKIMFLVDTENPIDDLSDMLTSGGRLEYFLTSKWDCSVNSELDLYIKFIEVEQ